MLTPSPIRHPDSLVFALPKGRILGELRPLMAAAGLEPHQAFDDPGDRGLQFATGFDHVSVVRVRSFDVASFVAFGAADIGVCGNDVLAEFDYSEIYAPLDLGIGRCRMVVACPRSLIDAEAPERWSHIRVATKYPEITRRHFARRGVQAECIRLSGAMELAPRLGMCRRIVDLVETGSTLRANGLVEVETIMPVSSRLVVNRAALKTRPDVIADWVARFRAACGARDAAPAPQPVQT
ncbi:MAG: ATP phosphoribosyltransferase [Alphaproteobacteria bacterium]